MSYFTRIVNAVLWVIVPLAGVLCAASADVVRVALGPQWSGSATVLRLAAIAIPAQAMCAMLGWALVSLGQGSAMLKVTAITTPAVVLGIWLGLPAGVHGVALAIVVVQVSVVLPMTLAIVRTVSPVTGRDLVSAARWPLLAGILVCGGAFAAGVAVSCPPGVCGLATKLAGALVGAVAALWLARPAREEVLGVVAEVRRAFLRRGE